MSLNLRDDNIYCQRLLKGSTLFSGEHDYLFAIERVICQTRRMSFLKLVLCRLAVEAGKMKVYFQVIQSQKTAVFAPTRQSFYGSRASTRPVDFQSLKSSEMLS